MFKHYSVLLQSVISFLPVNGNQLQVLDCTGGAGGHSSVIIEQLGDSLKRLDIIEWDLQTYLELTKKFGNNQKIFVHHKNFKDATDLNQKYDFILVDLGLNNQQLRDSSRGFNFKDDSTLDMRINQSDQNSTALNIINSYSKAKLAEIFFYYGEVNYAKKLAEDITIERQKGIITPKIFWKIIDKYQLPRRSRINPRTLVIQALRIEANQELLNLQTLLNNLDKLLNPNGVAVIISFHSLEDRLVKQAFRQLKDFNGYQILTKKPMQGKDLDNNTNARSAKLRAIKK